MPLGSDMDARADRGGAAPTGDIGLVWFLLGVIACTLIAFGVRLYKIDAGSFWNDELYTVMTAADFHGKNLSKLFGYVPARVGLELQGVDLKALDLKRPETWAEAGVTEWSLRLPHVLIGALSVPALMLAGRRALGERGALVFGALLAVSQWHVYWSQAGRFYIVQFVFFSLALLLWHRSARSRRPVVYVGAMVCAFFAFWSQPQALLVYAVMGIDWAVSIIRRDPIRLALWQWIVGGISAGACVTLLAIDLTKRTGEWTHFLGSERWNTPQEVLMGVVYFVWPATAAVAGLGGLWLLANHRRLGVLLCAGAVVPPAVFVAMSFNAFIGSRYAFMCLGPTLMIAAVVVVRLGEVVRPAGGRLLAVTPAAAVVVGQVFATMIYFRSGGNFHLPMNRVAWYIAAHNQAGEAIWAHEDEVIRYYARTAGVRYLDAQTPDLATIDSPAWFVFQAHPGDEPDPRSLAPGMHFERRFGLLQSPSGEAVDVYRYEPPAR
ncbi:MAG: glycosyltransferase family 39 protein [Phycisphaerales bacterium]